MPATTEHSPSSAIAETPVPPYWAVIFTSLQTADLGGYSEAADLMFKLASEMPGFLGFESVRETLGVTVSYWRDEDAIRNWKLRLEHTAVQKLGQKRWYEAYRVRVARVERDYRFERGV